MSLICLHDIILKKLGRLFLKKVLSVFLLFTLLLFSKDGGFDFQKTYNHKTILFLNQILHHLKNTGYSNRPFYLEPKPHGNIDKNTKFNLFVDCSGFVGYYVLQILYPKLYKKLPRNYSCGPLKPEKSVLTPVARPLAADFVDYFKSLHLKATRKNSTADKNKDKCWARVYTLKDALPGDILAYTHERNIDKGKKYCCKKVKYKNHFYYKMSKMTPKNQTCSNGQVIYKTKIKNSRHLSTGHVAFIANIPKLDKNGEYRLKIIDATNVLHDNDSRKESGYGYKSWKYEAVNLCKDLVFAKSCKKHKGVKKRIKIRLSHFKNPTGVGEGTVYIKKDLKSIRVNSSKKVTKANIVIGRIVNCN